MCDTGNLIDFTGWDEPKADEIQSQDKHAAESVLIESTNFKGPYDPFESVEKEACIKGLNIQDDKENIPDPVADIQFEYLDHDLNNETPPVAMDMVQSNADVFKISSVHNVMESKRHNLCKQVANMNAMKASGITTPHHSFSRDAMLTGSLTMIAAESPIKLVDEPTTVPVVTISDNSTTCSDIQQYDERLKMVRNAMSQLQSKVEEQPMPTKRDTNLESCAQHVESPHVVDKLLGELNLLVSEHVDASKRKMFDMVIELLRIAVQSGGRAEKQTKPESPHTYTRQATFDLDLELQKKKSEPIRNVQEFPDVMTCSSATFDGEPQTMDMHAMPIIETSMETETVIKSPRATPDSYVTEVVNDNLALQINELLERHNLTKLHMQSHEHQQQIESSEHNETKSVGGGPTVILVVNSNAGPNQLPSCVVHPSTTKTAVKPMTSNSRASTLRRRSSSLSIHDKQDRPRTLVKQSSGDSTTTTSSTTNTNPHVPAKDLSIAGDKLNVMNSFRQRRNSFSVGLMAGKANSTAAALAQSRSIARSKTATINESIAMTKSPKKDAIPVKRVAPMVKPALSVPGDKKHLNSTMPRSAVQDTPLARPKTSSKLFCTSTPMPQMPRRSLKPINYGKKPAN